MTATQVFMLFLKDTCTIDELRFFKQIIMKDCGNKYFMKRPLFTPTFVEDYLARNNRALNNFMTRLFILAPNLEKLKFTNPRWHYIRREFGIRNKGKEYTARIYNWDGSPTGYFKKKLVVFHPFRSGMYVNYYRRAWNKFLRENIESEKKFNSPFKNGESYDFKLKTKDDICL
jgi:hypothetical protein